MQDIFREFCFWLLKFLAVSVGILVAAKWWIRRRRKQKTLTSEESVTPPAKTVRSKIFAVLLMALVPVACLFSIAPLTEWAFRLIAPPRAVPSSDQQFLPKPVNHSQTHHTARPLTTAESLGGL